MKKLIEKQFIQGETIHELSRTCLEKVDYKAVNRGFKNWLYSDGCFRERLCFLTLRPEAFDEIQADL